MDLQLAGAQGRGDLEPDEARAHHDGVPRLLCVCDDRACVAERAQHVDVRLARAGNVEANRLGAGREHELVEGHVSPARDSHLLRLHVDAGDIGAERDVDRMLAVEFGRLERDPVFRRVAGEIVLRAVRPVVGSGVVGGQQRDAAGEALAPKHLGGRECGGAAAHDHHALGIFARAWRLARAASIGRRDLFAHAGLSVALVHAPARHRIERRRSDRLAGAQAEAGMVPRAAHGVVDRQSLGERPAVV